jgi:uncharacterized protein YeaO (DUF488 family)
MRPHIKLKRVYEPAEVSDGRRILVERLWPRGIRKTDLILDDWMKQLAPSSDLRTWFGHDPDRWSEFSRRYRRELALAPAAALVRELAGRARTETLTLLYSARDREHNSARLLAQQIARLARGTMRKGRPKRRQAVGRPAGSSGLRRAAAAESRRRRRPA